MRLVFARRNLGKSSDRGPLHLKDSRRSADCGAGGLGMDITAASTVDELEALTCQHHLCGPCHQKAQRLLGTV